MQLSAEFLVAQSTLHSSGDCDRLGAMAARIASPELAAPPVPFQVAAWSSTLLTLAARGDKVPKEHEAKVAKLRSFSLEASFFFCTKGK